MKRISLGEKEFKELVSNGEVTVDEQTLNFEEMEQEGTIKALINGEIVEQYDCLIALNDIGYDKIFKILCVEKF